MSLQINFKARVKFSRKINANKIEKNPNRPTNLKEIDNIKTPPPANTCTISTRFG